jgi:hypothetical protein
MLPLGGSTGLLAIKESSLPLEAVSSRFFAHPEIEAATLRARQMWSTVWRMRGILSSCRPDGTRVV